MTEIEGNPAIWYATATEQRPFALATASGIQKAPLAVHHTNAPDTLWSNANDRLPRAPLGRVEGRNCVVEGRDVADVRP
jgi:hypothetical protein